MKMYDRHVHFQQKQLSYLFLLWVAVSVMLFQLASLEERLERLEAALGNAHQDKMVSNPIFVPFVQNARKVAKVFHNGQIAKAGFCVCIITRD